MIGTLPILVAAWAKASTQIEFYIGVAILVIAVIWTIYKFATGEWTWEEFNKGS